MKRRIAILIAVAIVLGGCGAWTWTKSLFVAGVSVEVVGNQFVSVSKQVTAGCVAGAIPAMTCEKYRVFGEHFKKVYPITVGLWRSAKDARDRAAQDKAEEVIIGLSEDLSRLAVEALGAFGGGK